MTEPGPFLPRVQEEYWVDGTILPGAGAGAGDRAAVVVLDVPATTRGTIGVAVRGRAGRIPVQGMLWTPASVAPAPAS
ncbi:MAG: hypothetical protein ACR2HM_03645 [Acidimicrobiales bacterium]